MYSPAKVAARIAEAELEYSTPFEYHSVEEVDNFEAYLRQNNMYQFHPATGLPSGTQNLSDFARRWMLNEQVLCLCDASYALSRYCNTPEAPVWMADLTFKPMGDIQVGDQVMGWKHEDAPRRSHHERLSPSRVIAISRRVAPIVRVTLASGRVIRCTPDHLWSSGMPGKSRTPWITARVGQQLRRVIDVYPNNPLPEHEWDAAWLGGVYDGEGHGTYIAQYRDHNPEVHERISKTLLKLGFTINSTPLGVQFNGGRDAYARFLVWCRPTRSKSLKDKIFRFICADRDRVISVEPDGESEVIGLQTETGNYTAWGYASKNCYVKNEQNVIERFRIRIGQKMLFDIICDLEDLGAAIEIMILKARQLGMSTLVELLIGLRIIFSYGINAVIGSADQSMTGRMAGMLFLMYDMLPVWLRPQWTRRVESDRGMLTFGAMASGVSFQHGAQKQGIGTGTTPTLYHLSEVALYADPVSLIDEGLWKAVHASPNVFGILESTGRGDKGWWADTWRFSRENWATRKSRMCPLFLPWFVGTDIYPTPTWIRTRPIPPSWRPNHDTIQHVAKCELYVEAEPMLNRHLTNLDHPGHPWRMPRSQQWFWECGHEEAKSKGTQASWYQEMAADDVEALQRSGGEPVFGHQVIAEIDSRRSKHYKVWGLAGQSIESAHEPLADYIDYHPGAERIPVRYSSAKGERYSWELIPMTFGGLGSPHPPLDESDPDAPMGLLIEYEPPTPNVSYSIGVDTSEGKGQDSTAISVWALGWDQRADRQVAEFASPYVSHVEAFSFILAIAAYYRRYMPEGYQLGRVRWKEPYVAIEQVAAVGDVAQSQMQRMGYSNFHRMVRYDKKNIGKLKRQSRSQGWFTYGWSRPILTGHFVHWVQNSWAEVESPWLLDEMRHFEIHRTAAGKERMEHEDDEHDDRIFAAAMAIFCPHDMDTLAQRSKKRSVVAAGLLPLDLSPQRGMILPASALRQNEKSIASLEELVYAGNNAGRRLL
jgi:hypothetical protein